MATRPDEFKVGERGVAVLRHMPGPSLHDIGIEMLPKEKVMVATCSPVSRGTGQSRVDAEVSGGFHAVELPVDVHEEGFRKSYGNDVLKVVIARPR